MNPYKRQVNWLRCLWAALAAVAVLFGTDFVIHGLLLGKAYVKWFPFARPQADMPVWPFVCVDLSWAVLLTWIFTFGLVPGRPGWQQGLRFGIYLGLFFWVPYSLLQYGVLPIPQWFVSAWIVAGTVQMMLAGLVIGLIYGPPAAMEGGAS